MQDKNGTQLRRMQVLNLLKSLNWNPNPDMIPRTEILLWNPYPLSKPDFEKLFLVESLNIAHPCKPWLCDEHNKRCDDILFCSSPVAQREIALIPDLMKTINIWSLKQPRGRISLRMPQKSSIVTVAKAGKAQVEIQDWGGSKALSRWRQGCEMSPEYDSCFRLEPKFFLEKPTFKR